MNFGGVFVVSAPKERVLGAVTDPNEVARCVPDLTSLEVKSEREFEAVGRVGVAIVRGDLSLRFRIVEKVPYSRVRTVAHGTGLGSAVDVEMVTELADGKDGGTSMKWAAEATFSGKIASLGQGMINSQAERIIRQLFDCLRGKLE